MLEDSRAEMQVNCDSFRGDASIVSNNRRDDVGVLAGNLSLRSRRSDRFTDHLGMGAAFTTHDRPESVLQDDEGADTRSSRKETPRSVRNRSSRRSVMGRDVSGRNA